MLLWSIHISTLKPQIAHVSEQLGLSALEGLGHLEFVNVQRAFHTGTKILTGGRDFCMIKLAIRFLN